MIGFSLLMGMGASLAILRVVQGVPRWQAPRWANASLLTLLGALLGARILYVGLQWSYYSSHLFEIFAVWQGGLHWSGGVCGGLLAVVCVAWRWKTALGKIADGLVPLVPPLVVSIWLANWTTGYVYGPHAPEGALWGVPSLDEYGLLASRFPLQLTAALFMLIYAVTLDARAHLLKIEGQKASLILLGLALDLVIFLPLRADAAPRWGRHPVDLWAALSLFAVSLGLCLLVFRNLIKRKAEQ